MAAWTAALERFCAERRDVSIVFPVGDKEIERTAPLAGRLPALVVAARSRMPCSSKQALLSMAASLGIPTPPWEVVDRPAALERAIDRLGLPAVLKPDVSTNEAAGFKVTLVRTAADVRRVVNTLPVGSSFVVQRFAPGVRHNVYFIASEGRMLGHADIRVLRTDRPDGTGLAVEAESVSPHPALLDWTRKLAAELAYTGVGCAQFLVDEATGAISFLEVNARLGANSAGTCACGHDLPRLFVDVLSGVAAEQPPAVVGRRYTWLHGDIDGLKAALDSGRITWGEAAAWASRLVVAQLRSRHHITWRWNDPLPTVVIHGRWLAASVRGLVRRLARR